MQIINNMNYKDSDVNQIVGFVPLLRRRSYSSPICVFCTNGLILPGELKSINEALIVILSTKKRAVEYLGKIRQKEKCNVDLYIGTLFSNVNYDHFTIRYSDEEIFIEDNINNDIWRDE